MPQFPKQFILIGDENLKESNVVSVSPVNDIRSKKTGPVLASENNEGDMTAFLSGSPTENVNYQFKGQVQGSTNEGTFVWKLSSESDNSYKGEPEMGLIHSVSLPSSNIAFFARSIFTTYSKKLNKEFCYYVRFRNTLLISYRDYTRRGEGAWSSTTFSFSSIGKTFQYGHRKMAGATLKDGSFVFAFISDTDIDVYVSTDGLTLEPLAENLFARKSRLPEELSNIQIAVSGNYVNISVVSTKNTAGSQIVSFISADNGNSWDMRPTTDLTITIPGKWSYPSLPDSQDEIWSIGSIDDDGTFILLNVNTEDRLVMHYATGKGSWSYTTGLVVPNVGITKPCIVQTSSRIYIFYQVTCRRRYDVLQIHESQEYKAVELAMIYAEKENFILGTSYFIGSPIGMTAFSGSSSTILRDLSVVENGSGGLNFTSNLMSLNGDQKLSFPFFRMGGWDTFPLRNLNNYNFRNNIEGSDPIERSFIKLINNHERVMPNRLLEFQPFMGTLSAGFMYNESTTPWSVVRGTSTQPSTINWRSDRIRITDYIENSEPAFLYKFLCRASFLPSSISETSAISSGAITNLGIVDEFDNPVYITDADTPDVNFAFIPCKVLSANLLSDKVGHGSLMSFVCKTSTGTTTNGVDSFTVAGISTFLAQDAISSFSSVSTTRIFNLEVRIGQANACLYDVAGTTSVATLTPDTTIYGFTPFSDNYWEFRLAIRPYNNDINFTVNPPDFEGYTSPKVMLMCRRLDREDWTVSGVYDANFFTTSWSSDIVLNQMVYFGHLQKQGVLTQSNWKSFMIHQGNDFGTFEAVAPDQRPVLNVPEGEGIRGRYLSSYPIPIDDGLSISWGGSGISVGDTFQMDIDHTYSPKNAVLFESPNIKFQSVDNPTQSYVDVVYEAKDSKSFSHDAFAVFNTALEKVEVNYSNDSSDFSTATTHTLNLSTDISGRIVGVNNNVITLELSNNNYSYLHQRQITSSNKRSWYLKTTTGQSSSGTTLFNGPVYKVDKSISIGSNQVKMFVDTNDLGDYFPISAATCQIPSYAVGVTMTIFSDRGILNMPTNETGRYMRVRSTHFPNGAVPFVKLGTFVAGMTMPFDVELNWSYTDKETPNTQKNVTRNGTEWIYEKGTPKREISLSMIGDITEKQRQQFRTISRGLSRYGKNPLVLVTTPESITFSNQGDLNEHIILSRYTTATDFKNDGWHYDEDLGVWTAIGNMSMIFEEII